ncbi:MAG: Hypothetical protein BHV28_06510 [Candidatus Tokpelaia hoelldobleri]|uniref:Mth938-like domain-containing protein n=1 Tax=Candidatus Tokpelaia hoelldobleri TaxID=1902579 RepID=A0A1U9JU04_9HYPH|nr:MAG: Hypothetical protein BHV28_06510 [Candidatus Tokpelaia hoelldoblerii]
MVIREAHFPGRAPIDAYGNGGFRFADMSHRGSILCLPSGIYGWQPRGAVPALDEIRQILDEAEEIEILLVGTGETLQFLPEDVLAALRARNIAVDSMSTGAAVRTFNVLLNEERAVAAALFAVD